MSRLLADFHAKRVSFYGNCKFEKALFLHIQKTAGSGIIETLRAAYGNQNVISHGDYLAGVSHFPFNFNFKISHQILEDFHDIHAITGHFGFAFAERYMQNRYTFTFLRNPIERILSFYYFCRSRNPDEFNIYRLCQEFSLIQFLSLASSDLSVRMFIWNNQAWQLFCGFGNLQNVLVSDFSEKDVLSGALKNLKRLSRVGFVETFQFDRKRILEDLGIEAGDCETLVNKSPSRPSFSDLDRSTQKALLSLTELDRELYDAAWLAFGQKNSSS